MVSRAAQISHLCVRVTPCRQRRTAKPPRDRQEGVEQHQQPGKGACPLPSAYLAGVLHPEPIAPDSGVRSLRLHRSRRNKSAVVQARRCEFYAASQRLRGADGADVLLHAR